jgi:hypothetical protein
MQSLNPQLIQLAQADAETERIAAKAQQLISYVRDHGRDVNPTDLSVWIAEVIEEFRTHCLVVVSGVQASAETIENLNGLIGELNQELSTSDGAVQAAYQAGVEEGVRQAQDDSLLAQWADAISGTAVYEER